VITEPAASDIEGATSTPARTDPLVVCDAVCRTFDRGGIEVGAVRDASCTVASGMQIALTGPSGSGKSTLLHLLAGLEAPSSGAVRWPALGGTPRERPGTVGVVFQGPSLIPALDVVENIALPLLLAGTGEDEAVGSACAALDRLRIGDLAHRLPDELSGGQAQRVAVARVLASGPRLILADEPTGRLDRDTGDRVVAVLLETAAELGAALVVSTHDLRVARRLARSWGMEDGRLATGEAP
jgi:ABC-type lipoprotein export system ATPase subunit